MASEAWLTVEVFGHADEIEHFMQQCVKLGDVDSFPIGQKGRLLAEVTGEPCIVEEFWNFRPFAVPPGSKEFACDMRLSFDERLFARNAEAFPDLAFYVECIGAFDEYLGYGWFNGPPGGEPFDFHDVPEGYWDRDGKKRGPLESLLHERRVAVLRARYGNVGSSEL